MALDNNWTDKALSAGLLERNPHALEALVRRYAPEMRYFIQLILEGVGKSQDAEECANDLFVATWQEFDSFDPERSSLRTWLTMRAKHIALDRRRQLRGSMGEGRGQPPANRSDAQAARASTQGEVDRLYVGLMQRDPRALEALIQQSSRTLFDFIGGLLEGLGTVKDTEECVNDLFNIAWQEVDTFDPARGSFFTWLTMRAKFIALDRRRQLRRLGAAQIPLEDQERPDGADVAANSLIDSTLEGGFEQRERRKELLWAMDRLPGMDRRLVYLRYFRMLSTEDIARAAGVPYATAAMRLSRARQRLCKIMEERSV